jgi:hypothetical protein
VRRVSVERVNFFLLGMIFPWFRVVLELDVLSGHHSPGHALVTVSVALASSRAGVDFHGRLSLMRPALGPTAIQRACTS